VHDALLRVHPDVRLHAEKPLLALARLMHLGIAFLDHCLTMFWHNVAVHGHHPGAPDFCFPTSGMID
jgi:hypothetical protein